MNTYLWQVRRELWESRSVWVVPAALAGAIVGAILLGVMFTHRLSLDGLDADTLAQINEKMTPDKLDLIATGSLVSIAGLFMLFGGATQFFYAADALYSERRDRSILFWRSLPISDTTAVLAKLTVALAIIPAAAIAGALVTQVATFTLLGAKLLPLTSMISGHLWKATIWYDGLRIDVLVLLAAIPWWLPPAGWALLCSAYAPRSPFLIAFFVPIGLIIVEWIAFHTSFVRDLLLRRSVDLIPQLFSGHAATAMVNDNFELGKGAHAQLDFFAMFAQPELWIGLVFGAACVAGAIYLRRYRETTA